MTDVKQLSEFSKSLMVLGGMIVSAAVGGFVTAGYFRDYSELPDRLAQLEERLKALQTENVNLQLRVDKVELTDADTISALAEKLNLPDFDMFAQKAELWTDQQLANNLTEMGFVKYSDRLFIVSEFADEGRVLFTNENNTTVYAAGRSAAPAESDEWLLRKSD